jgi:hypothetical protein
MTPQQISSDVSRGLVIRDQIKTWQAELRAIEKRLEQAGLEGDQIPLQEPDREGRQFLARSPGSGVVVPVVFESDQIVASFQSESVLGANIIQFCELRKIDLSPFYQKVSGYARVPKDGQQFRKIARERLDILAPDFLAHCLQRDKDGIPKSRTIIAWDNVKPLDHIPA